MVFESIPVNREKSFTYQTHLGIQAQKPQNVWIRKKESEILSFKWIHVRIYLSHHHVCTFFIVFMKHWTLSFIVRHHFKLNHHVTYGDAISLCLAGAFASLNEVDVTELYTIITCLLKKEGLPTRKPVETGGYFGHAYDAGSKSHIF